MKKQQGFTLIELLIVIAIISLIGSIIFPNFAKIQSKAKETSLQSNLHTIQLALESYYLNTGAYPTGESINLVDLETILEGQGALNKLPKNPYTGKTYTAEDGSGKITYNYDETEAKYTLSAYGQGNSEIIFSLENN